MRNGNSTTRLSRMILRYLPSLLIFLLLSSTSTASTTTTASHSGQCFPEQTPAGSVYACADNSEYRTHMGLPCSFHGKIISLSDGENCFNEWLAGTSQGATWLTKTYDQNQMFELIWECPCSCNVKCSDSDEEPTASPTRVPSMQDNGPAAPSASGAFHPVGGIGLSDKEFHGSGGSESESESVRNQSDGEEQPINSRMEDDEADEAVSTVVVAPVVSDSSPDAPTDIGGNVSLQFVAMIAGAVVGVAVLCVSVLSLIQNVRKKRGQIGSNLVDSTPTQHRGDLVSSLSDISVSVASGAESLNSEEKIRLYKAWKLAIMNRKGVEDGFDVVEP